MLACPFCGARETDRFEIDGQGFLVFACMFSPSVDLRRSDTELAAELASSYGGKASAYFRGMCDRLHLVVTQRPELMPKSEAEPSST